MSYYDIDAILTDAQVHPILKISPHQALTTPESPHNLRTRRPLPRLPRQQRRTRPKIRNTHRPPPLALRNARRLLRRLLHILQIPRLSRSPRRSLPPRNERLESRSQERGFESSGAEFLWARGKDVGIV